MVQDFGRTLAQDLNMVITSNNFYQDMLVLLLATIAAFYVSKLVARGIVKVAQLVGTKSDSITNKQKLVRYRQIETYLSISIAMTRGVMVAGVVYFTWRLLNPTTSGSVAAIGAGTLFIVIAGQTLGPMLRDLTSGSAMITEGWFHVGDYVKIEPFMDVAGVVERFTLRSTKLRSLSGEVIWVHNQQIHAVHVTSSASRKFIVDVFTHEPSMAQAAIQEVIDAVPSSSTMIKDSIKISEVEKWDSVWHIIIDAQTAPGREWMVERFFINALKTIDEGKKKEDRLFAYEPIARFADSTAEKEFRRVMR